MHHQRCIKYMAMVRGSISRVSMPCDVIWYGHLNILTLNY